MLENAFKSFYETQILANLNNLGVFGIIAFVLDITIVLFLIYKAFGLLKGTRAWQLLKGIVILIILTFFSGYFRLTILNYILTSVMSYSIPTRT